MGDSVSHLSRAVSAISKFANVLELSKIYQTKPWGYLEQDDFLNAVILAETKLEPSELLIECKKIESEFGRDFSQFRNAPRPIDIDIIFYEDLEISTPELTIPHAQWQSRDFVITPLLDIAVSQNFINAFGYKLTQQILSNEKSYNPFAEF